MSAVIRGLMPCILSAPHPEAVAMPDLVPALVKTDSTRSVLRNRIQQHKAVSTTSAAALIIVFVSFIGLFGF